MYYIWQHILTYDQGKLRLNLLLNRASEWVDVCSYIPYQGKVEIVVKKPLERRAGARARVGMRRAIKKLQYQLERAIANSPGKAAT